MKTPIRILATALVAMTLLAGAGTTAAAGAPGVYWYFSPVYFCPVRYTTYGQLIQCSPQKGIWRLRKDDDAELFFPNILARDSEGMTYYADLIKAYKVVGQGHHAHEVALGEQVLGSLALPGVSYNTGGRHYVHERLSQLTDPIFGVRRTQDERPITWSCNRWYVFYVATGRGEVHGRAQLYLSC